MAKKRNSLRDQIAVVNFTEVKQPNGDIERTTVDSPPFRCNATHRDTELIDRIYDAPQVKFDYVLRMRKASVLTAGMKMGTIITIPSVADSGLFQVTQIINDSDRKTRVFVVSTN